MSRSITFGLDANGLTPVARSHVELVAGGLERFSEVDVAPETPLLSTIPIASLAGIALTILPWLLSGGTLHLHHGFDPDVFAAQCGALGDAQWCCPRPRLQQSAMLASSQTRTRQ